MAYATLDLEDSEGNDLKGVPTRHKLCNTNIDCRYQSLTSKPEIQVSRGSSGRGIVGKGESASKALSQPYA